MSEERLVIEAKQIILLDSNLEFEVGIPYLNFGLIKSIVVSFPTGNIIQIDLHCVNAKEVKSILYSGRFVTFCLDNDVKAIGQTDRMSQMIY